MFVLMMNHLILSRYLTSTIGIVGLYLRALENKHRSHVLRRPHPATLPPRRGRPGKVKVQGAHAHCTLSPSLPRHGLVK